MVDIISYFIVGIIICILFYSIHEYIRPLKALKKEIHQLNVHMKDKEINLNNIDSEFIENMQNAPMVKIFFDDFAKASSVNKGNNTIPHIEDYVNYDLLVDYYGNRPILNFVPGFLTALGILGTFIGLYSGLKGIDIETVDTTQKSVINLISGMSGAFSTSIAGILASIVLNSIDRCYLNKLNEEINIFNKSFGKNNYMIKGSDVLNAILSVQEEQRDYFRTFAEDISIKLSETITESFNSTLVPQFEQIKQVNESLIKVVSGTQVEGMDKIVQSFMDQVNGLFGDQFENMADTIENLLKWQTETKNLIDKLVIDIAETSQLLVEQNKAAAQTADIFSQNISKMQETSIELNSIIEDIKNVTSYFGIQVDQYQNQYEKMKILHEQSTLNVETINTSLGNFEKNISNTKEHLEKLNDSLSISSEKFQSNLIGSLNSTFTSFDENLSLVSSHFVKLLDKIRIQTEDFPDIIDDLNNNIRKFDETIMNVILKEKEMTA